MLIQIVITQVQWYSHKCIIDFSLLLFITYVHSDFFFLVFICGMVDATLISVQDFKFVTF